MTFEICSKSLVYLQTPNRLKTFVQIAYIFHPDMGYDVNLMLRHFAGKFTNILITSEDASLWNETAESIVEKDKAFEIQYQCKIIRLPYFKTNPGNTVPLIKNLGKTMRNIKPDYTFVHGLESHAFSLGMLRVLKYGGSLGLDTHTLYNQIKNASFIWKLYRSLLLKPIIVKRINRLKIPIFFTAQDNRHFLIHYLGINENLVYTNEIATNLSVFYHFIDAGLKSKLQMQDGEKVVMYIGKFDEFKQPHLLLDAIQLYGETAPFPIHVIMGGPKNKTYYEKYFAVLPKIKNIRFTILESIPNQELYKYYSLADVVVIPEQNSLSALDAQACKTPVILKDDATNRERVLKGGLVYEENNILDLKNKIDSILRDPEFRNQLAENGYQYIAEKYNYITTMDTILGILNQHTSVK